MLQKRGSTVYEVFFDVFNFIDPLVIKTSHCNYICKLLHKLTDRSKVSLKVFEKIFCYFLS